MCMHQEYYLSLSATSRTDSRSFTFNMNIMHGAPPYSSPPSRNHSNHHMISCLKRRSSEKLGNFFFLYPTNYIIATSLYYNQVILCMRSARHTRKTEYTRLCPYCASTILLKLNIMHILHARMLQ